MPKTALHPPGNGPKSGPAQQTPRPLRNGPAAMPSGDARGSAIRIDLPRDNAEGPAPVIIAVDQGAHGAVTIEADRSLLYRPDPDFVGDDIFSYTERDATGAIETATVTVTRRQTEDGRAGDAARAVTIDLRPCTEGRGADGTGAARWRVASVGMGAHGTTTLNPDGTVTYTPRAGFCGDDIFAYTLMAGPGRRDHGSVTVTIGRTAARRCISRKIQ